MATKVDITTYLYLDNVRLPILEDSLLVLRSHFILTFGTNGMHRCHRQMLESFTIFFHSSNVIMHRLKARQLNNKMQDLMRFQYANGTQNENKTR